MISIPQPGSPTATYPAVFDAWNRLMALTGTETYAYDGLHRRTLSTVSGVTRYFYYSGEWQVLEERTGAATSVPDRQYVWGLHYVDDLVLRDRAISGTLERLYALQDANWNVVAIYSDLSSAVEERFAYTAYGVVMPLNPDFSAPTPARTTTGPSFSPAALWTTRAGCITTACGIIIRCRRVFAKGSPLLQRRRRKPLRVLWRRPGEQDGFERRWRNPRHVDGGSCHLRRGTRKIGFVGFVTFGRRGFY